MKKYDSLLDWCSDNGERGTVIQKEWNEDTNRKIFDKGMNDFKPQSNIKVWWICSVCNKHFLQSVRCRTGGQSCPTCAIKARQKKMIEAIRPEQSIAVINEKLAEYLDEQKNIEQLGLSNNKITETSSRKVYWKCPVCADVWQTTPKLMTFRKYKCKKCRRNKRV